MSKDSGGLLSKVAKFVLNPTTSWADLDQPASVPQWEHTKAVLKEMVERKKRNDFIRNREFDALRKIRRAEAAGTPEVPIKPSFFQTSLQTSPGGRADTLKKIDEIEAQMSMQWWKTKRAEGEASALAPVGEKKQSGSESSSEKPKSKSRSSGDDHGFAATEPMARPSIFGKIAPGDPAARSSIFGKLSGASKRREGQASAFAPTALVSSTRDAGPAFSDSIPAMLPQLKPVEPEQEPVELFSASKAFAIEVGEIAHDPELEEAAIRFANGDDAGAEQGLLALLQDASRSEQVEGWLALFDLYRATGQQERFESTAMDFVNRFQRSAPQWFSMLEAAPAPAAAPVIAGGAQSPHWTCPAVVSSQTLAALQAVVGRTKSPWRLDWSKLASLENEDVVAGLAQIFESWCAQPVKLGFLGAEQLEQFLAERTPVADASVQPVWWRLRLAFLRLLGRETQFDDTAVDYCVTYEVSPPSWEKPACVYIDPTAEAQPDSGGTPVAAAPAADDKLELSGVILGDAAKQLEAFDGRDKTSNIVIVFCGRLARVDFAAAGTLLNWVSAHQAEGRQVQFKDVHRLLAAFFYVIGISEQAKIVLRND